MAPRFPEMVRNTSITASSAHIQWMVSGTFNATRLEQFIVMYGIRQGNLNLSSLVINATSGKETYSTQLSSLEAGIIYYYMVVSSNQFAMRSSIEISFLTEDASKF